MTRAAHRSHDHSELDDRGAAVVEFAIVLLPMLLILLGIIEFGRLYSQQLTMQQAAREAARTLALKYDDPGITDPILDGMINDTVTDLVPGVGDIAELSPTIDKCDPAGTSDETATVTLEDNLSLRIPMPSSVVSDVPISATAQMPCEG